MQQVQGICCHQGLQWPRQSGCYVLQGSSFERKSRTYMLKREPGAGTEGGHLSGAGSHSCPFREAGRSEVLPGCFEHPCGCPAARAGQVLRPRPLGGCKSPGSAQVAMGLTHASSLWIGRLSQDSGWHQEMLHWLVPDHQAKLLICGRGECRVVRCPLWV